MTEFRWSSAVRSDVGRVRDTNEDSVFTSAASGVFVIADGMGGHAAGEVASTIASRTIGDSACRACDSAEGDSTEGVGEQLVAAFLAAGREISRQVEADPSRSGMGTTATVLKLRRDGVFVIAHIGDSRAYLWRDGDLRRMTEDHSWVQEQVDRGLITPEQAVGHPQSNIITRALGTEPRPTPDLYEGELAEGDVFLLATDGLTDMVPEKRIAELMAGSGSGTKAGNSAAGAEAALEHTARTLVDAANEAGGVDNVTVLLVTIQR